MKAPTALVVCLILGVAFLTTQTISGQTGDPRLGTWKLNLAKSKFTGIAPREQTRVYEDRGGGIVFYTQTTTTATGATTVTLVLFKLDGKEYPQLPRSAETTTTVAQKRIDAHTIEGTINADGNVTAGFTQVVSADGKTLTYTNKDAKGQPTGTVQVFDKQSGTP